MFTNQQLYIHNVKGDVRNKTPEQHVIECHGQKALEPAHKAQKTSNTKGLNPGMTRAPAPVGHNGQG